MTATSTSQRLTARFPLFDEAGKGAGLLAQAINEQAVAPAGGAGRKVATY